MITSHQSPSDYIKGKAAKTKDELYKEVLGKPYNTQEKYQSGRREVNNFVESVEENTGKPCTTFTLKYGRKPLATFPYDEATYPSKENFIKEVLEYAKDNSSLKDAVWEMHKDMAKTNGENARGGEQPTTGTSLQEAS